MKQNKMRQHQQAARNQLRSAIWSTDMSISDFAALLTECGYPHTHVALSNKLYRGTFSAGFFLLCKELLNNAKRSKSGSI